MTSRDPRLVADWPLDEQAASVLPSDASGHLPDLAVPAGLTMPPVAQGTLTGFGRAFTRAPATAFEVDDDGALRLRRNMATLWLAELDVAALADDDRATLIQRGSGGAGDPISFGLRVVVTEPVADGRRACRLEMYWQTEAGADVVDEGAGFLWPLGAPLLIAATREVVGGQLACRYQINGHGFGGAPAHDLDCGGEDDAPVTMGAGRDGAVYQDHWLGTLAAGQVVSEAVAQAELTWLWERISIDQPAGVKMIRAFVPPGEPFVYSPDPESDVQRELAIEGMALGYAKSIARRLRFYLLPDVAWGAVLERWEAMTQALPRPGDDIATRQARVSAFLGSFLGAGAVDVKIQLEELLGLDAVDIELLEYNNDRSVPFDGSPEGGLRIPGNLTFTVAGGELSAYNPGGDVRWLGPATDGAALRLWGLSSGVDAWISGKVSATDVTGNAFAGLVVGSRIRDEWVFVGVRITASGPVTSEIVWCKYIGGELDATYSTLEGAWDEAVTHLALHVLEDGTIDVRWGTTLAAAQAQAPSNIDPGIDTPEWAGLFFGGADDANGEPEATVAFDDFFSHTPQGTQRYNWWAYRDPGLPGTYDLEGARLLIQRLALAHYHAGATTTRALACGDPDNGCGEAPLGLGD